ncbi:hypothetical protein IWZ01DRAFT_485647 [Phyllosticta capitalensis]
MDSTTHSCPLWRQRLGYYVSTRLGMDSKHFYVERFHFLEKHDASFWAEQLEEIAIPEFKNIMNGDQPPSWDALSTLPPATDVERLDCYALQIRNPSDNERHLYPGSASGVDRWISYRIFEHVHQVYPSTSFLNRLLDDPLKPRTCNPRVTGIYPALKKGDQEELVVMRLALLLFEEFTMVMLKTFFPDKAGSTRQTLRELCPWYDAKLEWSTTNYSVPLAENFRMPKALISLDPEERLKYVKARHKEYDAERRKDPQFYSIPSLNRKTLHMIVDAIEEMKEAGIPQALQDDWTKRAEKKCGQTWSICPMIKDPSSSYLPFSRTRMLRQSLEQKAERPGSQPHSTSIVNGASATRTPLRRV